MTVKPLAVTVGMWVDTQVGCPAIMPIGRGGERSPGSAMPLPDLAERRIVEHGRAAGGELLHAGQDLPRNHADQELRVFDGQVQRGNARSGCRARRRR